MINKFESMLARIVVVILLASAITCAAVGGWIGRLLGRGRSRRRTEFEASGTGVNVVMVGTFYNDGWYESHVAPLIASSAVRRIFVVNDAPVASNPKVVSFAPGQSLARMFGRSMARFFALIQLAWRERSQVFMGYHIMPNALLCLIVARWFGGTAIYQMTGGPVQIIGGGFASENALLRRQRLPSRLREWLMTCALQRFDHVIVRGKNAAEFVEQKIGTGRCTVIPGGVDVRRFYSAAPSSASTITPTFDLVAVGRLVPVKRYDRMLSVVAELKRRRPGIHLAIVGDGPLREALQCQADDLRITENVTFLGRQTNVPDILRSARAFILTSENEGLSIAMMEAMASGLPAIVPNVGDLCELVRPDATGILIDPAHPVGAATAIDSLLENEQRLTEMSQAARCAVANFSSIECVADAWTRLLTSICPPAPKERTPPTQRLTGHVESRTLDHKRAPAATAKTAIAVFFTALAVRALFCFAAIPLLHLPIGPGQADFYTSTDGYVQIAATLVDHGRYAFSAEAPLTTYRAPMFPFALAAMYWMIGDMGAAVCMVNCLASAATCLLVFLIAVRLFGAAANYWTMLPAVLFPLSIYYCASSFSDTFLALTVALYALALVALFEAADRQRRSRTGSFRTCFCGAAFALAALTKAIVIPIPAFMCGLAYFRRRDAFRGAVSAMVVGFAIVGLWTARNYWTTGRLVLVTGGSGYNALIGNFMIDEWSDCDQSLAHGRREARRHLAEQRGAEISTDKLRPAGFLDVPPQLDSLYGLVAYQMMLESPMLAFRKLASNVVRFWYFSSSPTKSAMNALVNGLVVCFAIIGIASVLPSRRIHVEVLFSLIVACMVLYSMIIVHSSRFCLPMVMVLTPLAGMGARRVLMATWLRLQSAPCRRAASAGG